MQRRGIGVAVIGGGYMGKAHAVALRAVPAVFETALVPRLVTVAASSRTSAQRYADAYGFERAADDWQAAVADGDVEAIVIASPQHTHRAIAEAAFARGLHVLCEKPLGASLDDAEAIAAAARRAGTSHAMGFNYIRTPATQHARELIDAGTIGDVTWFRGEHTEDFLADPDLPATWRTTDRANGTMGDLAPHMIQCAQGLHRPIVSVSAQVETVHKERPDGRGGRARVMNDDQAQAMVRFGDGTSGHLFFSRIATGRKMGYAYEVHGTKGAIRFDQEDQNALHLYLREGPGENRGFTRILAGPEHPDYLPFCQGPGHGTGYQDQIIIEHAHWLEAIAAGTPSWPNIEDGLSVARVVDACHRSGDSGQWESVNRD